jgi:NADH dehydrogenase (ubiquinone) Fe-S protein 1
MIFVQIDGIEILIDKGKSVLQACEFLKKDVPRFCYHKELLIAGNCRMCLVEIERFPKPVASCAMPLSEKMIIYTETPLVRKARESVLEFLLMNHPLDCPICDQGGECDLQNQTFKFGGDRSRFFKKYKRSVEDKNFGILIKTVMTRCIHCTRCVRFADEIAGVNLLGTTGRGSEMEIGFYIKNIFQSELSGNVIDLCPVGALTSKPYAFSFRPWELKEYNSIDLNDALGAHIRVDVRDNRIIRILPRNYYLINDSWISDKARFSFDGIRYQRLINIFFYGKEISWRKFMDFFVFVNWLFLKKNYKELNLQFLCGRDTDFETLEMLQNLVFSMGFCTIQSVSSLKVNYDFESNYKFNTSFIDFETSDVNLILSSNLRNEAPNLNIKLKQNLDKNGSLVGYIGTVSTNTYYVENLGLSSKVLIKIAEGKHFFSKKLKKAKSPKIILGAKNNLIVSFHTFLKIVQIIEKFISKKNIINIISLDPASVGAMDLGISAYEKKKNVNFFYSINVSRSFKPLLNQIIQDSLILSQNYQAGILEAFSKILLPGVSFFEKEGSYRNLEGKSQLTVSAISPSKGTRKDFYILNLLLSHLTQKGFSLTKKRFYFFNQKGKRQHFLSFNFGMLKSFKIFKSIFDFPIKNFYKTDNLSEMSLIMSKLSSQFYNFSKNFS